MLKWKFLTFLEHKTTARQTCEYAARSIGVNVFFPVPKFPIHGTHA